MTKKQLIDLFGSQSEVARMIGIARSSVCEWPQKLPQRLTDEIIGAALRTKRLSYADVIKVFPQYGR